MPNEEDYLDGLLSSITQKKSDIEELKSREESEMARRVSERTRISPDDDFLEETGLSGYRPSSVGRENLKKAFSESGFLSDFEKTLSDGTADDFLRSFEAELDDDEMNGGNSEAELSAFLDDKPKKAPAADNSGADQPASPESTGAENFNLSFDMEKESAPFPERDTSIDEKPDEALLGSIDEIVKNAKKQVEEGPLSPSDNGSSFVSNLDMFNEEESEPAPITESVPDPESAPAPETGGEEAPHHHEEEDALSAATELADLFPDGDTSAKEVPLMDETGEGQDLLNILGEDGEFSDIGDLLSADENQEEIPEAKEQFEASASSVASGEGGSFQDDSLSEDGGEKKKKGGFLGKLLGIFKKKKKGEAAEEETPAASEEPVDITPINPTAEELSSETDDLLAEFGELPEAESTEAAEEKEDDGKKKKKGKKEKKKKGKKGEAAEGEEGEDSKDGKDKKEDKKKSKAEKKAAKEAAKAAAKAADTSPIIPKKAIIVFAIFGISVSVLVYVLSKTISQKMQFSDAEAAYNRGDYHDAYTKFSGIALKGDDEMFLTRSKILGTLDLRLSQYEVAMKYEKYDIALDSLIIAEKSYETNKEYAATIGIGNAYDSFGQKIEEQLLTQFGVSKEKALELYDSKGRVAYSIAITRILRELKLVETPAAFIENDTSDGDKDTVGSNTETGNSADAV